MMDALHLRIGGPPHTMTSLRRHRIHLLLPLLLPLLLLLSSLPFSSSASCSDPSDISCGICPQSARGNDIANLPRINARGHLLTNDLGSYSWYSCDAFGRNCLSFLSNPQYSHWLNQMPDDSHPINYVQSVAAYCLFALACALLSLVMGFSLCCCRYWYDRDMGGLCGGSYPQRKLRYIGLVIDPERRLWHYRPRERWAARALMLTFVLFLWTWVGLGYFNGTAQLPADVKTSLASPSAFAPTLQATQGPLLQLVTGVAAGTLYSALTNISAAFTSTVSLPLLVSNMHCVDGPLHDLPDFAATTTVLSNLTQVGGVILTAQRSLDAAINASLASLTSPLTQAAGNLSQYNAAAVTAAALSAYTAANASVVNPLAAVAQGDGGVVGQALVAFNVSAPNASALAVVANSSAASLAQLNANASQPLPFPSDRLLLLGRWANLTSTLAALPNLTAVAANATRYNAEVAATLTPLAALIASFNRTSAAITAWAVYGQRVNASVLAFNATASAFSMAPELAVVNGLNATLTAWVAGEAAAVGVQAAQLSNFSGVLPCMQALVPQLDATNAQLLSLSSNLSSTLTDYTQQLNVTLPLILSTLTNVSASLYGLQNSTAALFNLSSVVAALNNASMAVSAITAVLNLTSFNALMSAQAATLSLLDLTSTSTSLAALNASLTASLIPASFLASLTSYQTQYESLTPNLTSFNADLVRWNADGQGVRRCNATQAHNCSYTRDCPLGEYCLLDHDRVSLLQAQLLSYPSRYPSPHQPAGGGHHRPSRVHRHHRRQPLRPRHLSHRHVDRADGLLGADRGGERVGTVDARAAVGLHGGGGGCAADVDGGQRHHRVEPVVGRRLAVFPQRHAGRHHRRARRLRLGAGAAGDAGHVPVRPAAVHLRPRPPVVRQRLLRRPALHHFPRRQRHPLPRSVD